MNSKGRNWCIKSRRCKKDSFISLASDEIVMDKLLNYKFDINNLKGVSFGDIYLSADETFMEI